MSSPAGASPQSWLERYIHKVSDIPPLSPQEEQGHVHALHGAGHAAAARILVSSHLRIVVYIARDYLKYEQPFEDLIQEGNVGLMAGVNCFNPDRGSRLRSFLMLSINAEIGRFVLNNWHIADYAISKEQHRLFVRMRGFKRGTGILSAAEVKAAATYLGVRQQEILRVEQDLGRGDIPFITGPGGIRNHQLLQGHDDIAGNGIAEMEDSQWSQRRIDCLLRAMSTLDARARAIVEQRWLNGGKKARLGELGRVYHLSGERIRQIQDQAFDAMRPLIR